MLASEFSLNPIGTLSKEKKKTLPSDPWQQKNGACLLRADLSFS